MPKGKKGKGKVKKVVNEKGASSYSSTGNARVDLFFKTVRGVDDGLLTGMLEAAWGESPLDTLKLIFNARDCRGGKGEKQIFATCLQWLAAKHPDTLKKNLAFIPEYGTWKDLSYLMGTTFENDALDLFAGQLQEDIKLLQKILSEKENANTSKEGKEEEKKTELVDIKKGSGISLAAKWAPTEGHKQDTTSKMAKKLAKRLCPKSDKPLQDYRKQILVPLRQQLKVTEVFMCSNRWGSIPYTGVASRCMNLNRKAFQKHDEARFLKYLTDVASGKTTIKGGQMFPHELAKYYFSNNKLDQVIELQWKTIIDSVLASGSLKDSIVVSDVSGSMSGTPMEVSVAMGLLISEVTEEPFKNVVITFHETPTFHVVKGANLMERVRNLKGAPWGGTTNFQAVFDMILERAKTFNLAPEAMPKKLFVISDMQFDQADYGGKWKTNYQVLQEKYKNAGYPIPQIIFWNVRANTPDFPVTVDQTGVAMIAGYSPSILKVLMDKGDIGKDLQIEKAPEKPQIDPVTVMRKAIDDERYNKLQV